AGAAPGEYLPTGAGLVPGADDHPLAPWTERREARRVTARRLPYPPPGRGSIHGERPAVMVRMTVSRTCLYPVGGIGAERVVGDSLSVETRYYLSNLPDDAELLNEAVRSHWGVENSLDWVRDVTFGEGRSRIREENAQEDFGLLRRLALCLLKNGGSS